MKHKKNKGFTLVELLVVIAIIAILVVLILVALGVARQKARDSQRKTDLRSIQTALELYASDLGSYPVDRTAVYTPGTMDKYLKPMPTDPLGATTTTGNGQYGYVTSNSNKDYVICAHLEQPVDSAKPTYAAGTVSSDTTQVTACAGTIQ